MAAPCGPDSNETVGGWKLNVWEKWARRPKVHYEWKNEWMKKVSCLLLLCCLCVDGFLGFFLVSNTLCKYTWFCHVLSIYTYRLRFYASFCIRCFLVEHFRVLAMIDRERGSTEPPLTLHANSKCISSKKRMVPSSPAKSKQALWNPWSEGMSARPTGQQSSVNGQCTQYTLKGWHGRPAWKSTDILESANSDTQQDYVL